MSQALPSKSSIASLFQGKSASLVPPSFTFWLIRYHINRWLHEYCLRLLWLMPGCDESCPARSTFFDFWDRRSTTAAPGSTYLTNLLGLVHARVHRERWRQQSEARTTVQCVPVAGSQYDSLLRLPQLRPLEELAAELGYAEDWRKWKNGRAGRYSDIEYLKAWLQDANSELIVCGLAAHLRHASMLEVRSRYRTLLGNMFLAILMR